jgi:cap2 methyltransferase
MRWHEIMRPLLTSLKFRLPWPSMGVVGANNIVEYLDGDIHLPIWGPRNTTESRLVIEKDLHSGTRKYNCLVYEEEMCYFNRVTRPSIHLVQESRADGLDGCYDCAAEARLLDLYSARYGADRISTGRINSALGRSLI